MRHKIAGRKFDRNTASRKALLRNLVSQLFQHDRIVTTQAKAKEVRSIAEKLITKAKREDLHSRRQVLKVVTDKTTVKRLFDVILAKLSDRHTGGYTRIIKLTNRKGDDAPMALLEIIEPGPKRSKIRKTSKKKGLGKGKSKPKKEMVADEKKQEMTQKPSIETKTESETLTKETEPEKAEEDTEKTTASSDKEEQEPNTDTPTDVENTKET